ncbi:MAG: ATP-binding protein [Pseudomonadota bacterium]
MTTQTLDGRAQQLAQAFETFNAMSSQLDRSYRELELRVATLNKQLQRQRDEKERLADRLSRVIATLPAGVLLLDSNGVVRECNQYAKRLFKETLVGKHWPTILSCTCTPSVHSQSEYTTNAGVLVSVSHRVMPKNEGKIILLTDITKTRELERRLARKARLSEMGETTARLAHQIRTPLASVMLYVSQLRKNQVSDSTRQKFTEKIVGRLSDLEILVNDMLCFARGSNGLEVTISPSSLLNETRQSVKTRLIPGQRIRVMDSTGDTTIRGNRHALVGALQNLANNALDAAGENARVEIGALLGRDKNLHFFVRDNGPGIDSVVKHRIFEPFFTTRSSGTGLGLAVVKSVATAHGGSCWVSRAKGGGSVFYLSIPVDDQQIIEHNKPKQDISCVGVA